MFNEKMLGAIYRYIDIIFECQRLPGSKPQFFHRKKAKGLLALIWRVLLAATVGTSNGGEAQRLTDYSLQLLALANSGAPLAPALLR